ncbi:MAG: hypothetical protein J7L88_01335 [Thermoplasmata archaeon]|nr:hypothetical protein [Thermoplasmata archaeon]
MNLRVLFAVVFLIIAIVVVPLVHIAKYSWKNRKLTAAFSILGAASVLIFLYLVWDLIPE